MNIKMLVFAVVVMVFACPAIRADMLEADMLEAEEIMADEPIEMPYVPDIKEPISEEMEPIMEPTMEPIAAEQQKPSGEIVIRISLPLVPAK